MFFNINERMTSGHRVRSGCEIRSNTSSTSRLSQLHESPDGENNADKKHNDEEAQEVEHRVAQSTEGSVRVPGGEDLHPGGVGDAVLGHGFLEVSVRNHVASVDEISGLPNEHDGHEESDQADGVEDSHEILSLVLVASQDDEEDHREGDERG